jgi:hypothetical protein
MGLLDSRMTRVCAVLASCCLRRCWDLCELDVTIKEIPRLKATLQRSVSMGCTHAYAVTLVGAKKLLALSLPHLTSVDFLFALLSRTGLLRAYSVAPRLFYQERDDEAHDISTLPECDPNYGSVVKMFTNKLVAELPNEREAAQRIFLKLTNRKDMSLATRGNGHQLPAIAR